MDQGRLYLFSMKDVEEDIEAIGKLANWTMEEAERLEKEESRG